MSDLYHSPEKHGLRIFGELDDPNACYSFGMFVVWEQIDGGALFFGQDSGCSCPSPFESVTSLADIAAIEDTPESWKAFRDELDEWRRSYGADADCGELEGQVSMHLAKMADARRRGTVFGVSEAAYRDAVARAEAAEAATKRMAEQSREHYASFTKERQAHLRLCQMLAALGSEITLYLDTEAPQTVTWKIQGDRTAETGAV